MAHFTLAKNKKEFELRLEKNLLRFLIMLPKQSSTLSHLAFRSINFVISNRLVSFNLLSAKRRLHRLRIKGRLITLIFFCILFWCLYRRHVSLFRNIYAVQREHGLGHLLLSRLIVLIHNLNSKFISYIN